MDLTKEEAMQRLRHRAANELSETAMTVAPAVRAVYHSHREQGWNRADAMRLTVAWQHDLWSWLWAQSKDGNEA